MEYSAREDQVGAKLRLTDGLTNLEWMLSEAFLPNSIPSPDRVTRKEALEQTWKLLSLGKITLNQGQQTLRITAQDIPLAGLGDIYSIRLRPIKEGQN
jgi:hypothetical protein